MHDDFDLNLVKVYRVQAEFKNWFRGAEGCAAEDGQVRCPCPLEFFLTNEGQPNRFQRRQISTLMTGNCTAVTNNGYLESNVAINAT